MSLHKLAIRLSEMPATGFLAAMALVGGLAPPTLAYWGGARVAPVEGLAFWIAAMLLALVAIWINQVYHPMLEAVAKSTLGTKARVRTEGSKAWIVACVAVAMAIWVFADIFDAMTCDRAPCYGAARESVAQPIASLFLVATRLPWTILVAVALVLVVDYARTWRSLYRIVKEDEGLKVPDERTADGNIPEDVRARWLDDRRVFAGRLRRISQVVFAGLVIYGVASLIAALSWGIAAASFQDAWFPYALITFCCGLAISAACLWYWSACTEAARHDQRLRQALFAEAEMERNKPQKGAQSASGWLYDRSSESILHLTDGSPGALGFSFLVAVVGQIVTAARIALLF